MQRTHRGDGDCRKIGVSGLPAATCRDGMWPAMTESSPAGKLSQNLDDAAAVAAVGISAARRGRRVRSRPGVGIAGPRA